MIASLFFLTEKRDGTIKARQCADGWKQRNYMVKEEAALPMLSTEAIFTTSVIDAKEKQEVAIVDLPGAFLHTENDQDVIMFMKGRLAELMTLIAPKTYRKHVTVEKGEKVFYVKVQKALYGMLKSVHVFYNKLRKDLKSARFKINPYNPCVANKWVNVSQMMSIWHVDDLKISHQDGWQNAKVIKWLGKIYGDIKVKRGRKHHHLGMDMDFEERRL